MRLRSRLVLSPVADDPRGSSASGSRCSRLATAWNPAPEKTPIMASELSLSPVPVGLAGRSGLRAALGPSYRVFRGFQHPWAPSLKDDEGYGSLPISESLLPNPGILAPPSQTQQVAPSLLLTLIDGKPTAMDLDLTVLKGRLKDARRHAKFATAEDAAKAIPMALSTLTKWESPGEASAPSLPQLLKLASAYQVSLDYLVGRVDHPTGLRVGEMLVDRDGVDIIRRAVRAGQLAPLVQKGGLRYSCDIPLNPEIQTQAEFSKLEDELKRIVEKLEEGPESCPSATGD